MRMVGYEMASVVDCEYQVHQFELRHVKEMRENKEAFDLLVLSPRYNSLLRRLV